jgi:hypothetical protein
MKQGVNQLWPTSVLNDKITDTEFLNDLTQTIFSNFDMSNPPSDFGGFDIFDLDSDVMHKFETEYVLPAFDRYMTEVFGTSLSNFPGSTTKAWITGYGKGYNMVSHNHSGAQLSAVFYILAEQQQSGGQIVFTDPRSNANRGYNFDVLNKHFENQYVTPTTGDFLVFPSFLYHHVEPYYSNLRLCIPVDLYLKHD